MTAEYTYGTKQPFTFRLTWANQLPRNFIQQFTANLLAGYGKQQVLRGSSPATRTAGILTQLLIGTGC